MSDLAYYEDLFKACRGPGGLSDTLPGLLDSLMHDDDICKKFIKDVNDMADKVIFFHGQTAIYQLSIPWDTCDRDILTERYQHLLSKRECGHLKDMAGCQICFDALSAELAELKRRLP